MKDAGFTARSNGGSAVLFEGNPKLGGKIVFHKPHPIAKIDPIMLRSIGKRMAKWFGWSRELFVTV
jgi:HicA toxin of bacterial toxin-antitoxin,